MQFVVFVRHVGELFQILFCFNSARICVNICFTQVTFVALQ